MPRAVRTIALTRVPAVVRRVWRTLFGPRMLPFAAPLVLVGMLAPWLWRGNSNAEHSPLFRDQAVYQYVGWALTRGMRMYVDVATVDGPFIAYFNALNLRIAKMAGSTGIGLADFRQADAIWELSVAAVFSAILLPRAAIVRGAWVERIARVFTWGLAGAAIWYSYAIAWDGGFVGQRDAVYALFGALSIAAAYASVYRPRITGALFAFAALFLEGLLLFGKHTNILYASLAFGAILFAKAGKRRRDRFVMAAAGFATGMIASIAMLAASGSLRGFWFWYMEVAFGVYRYFATQDSLVLLYSVYKGEFPTCVFVLVACVGAISVRAIPPRAVVFGLGPLFQFASAAAQGKGWAQYTMPIHAMTRLFFIFALVTAWNYRAHRARWGGVHMAVAVSCLLWVSKTCTENVMDSPIVASGANDWLSAFARAGHRVADALKDSTAAGDRVLFFGEDPRPLMWADRLPAIAPAANHFVDFEKSLLRAPPTRPMTAAQFQRVQGLQARLDAKECPKLIANRPSAIAVQDGAPSGPGDGLDDIRAMCPAFDLADYDVVGRWPPYRVLALRPKAQR